MNYDSLFKRSYSNVAFMGGWREDIEGLTGFLTILSDGKMFVALNEHYTDGELSHYTVLPYHLKTYRYINDMIWFHIKNHLHDDNRSIGHWKQLVPSIYNREIDVAKEFFTDQNMYVIVFENISANIHRGDKVKRLYDGIQIAPPTFIVDGTHDLRYINENQFYQLYDQRVEHPKMVTFDQIVSTLLSIDPFKKYGFQECERPKEKAHLLYIMKVRDRSYQLYRSEQDDSTYYIADGNGWYVKHHTVFAPAIDLWNHLKSRITCRYDKDSRRIEINLFDVEENSYFMNKQYPVINTRWDEYESYHYNNFYIKITGNNPHF